MHIVSISKRIIIEREGEKTIAVKAFQFKLKPVLEMRIRELEEVQQRFALQQHRVVELRRLIEEIKDQLQAQFISEIEDIVDPIVSQQRFKYIQYLKMQIEHIRAALHREEQVLEKIRQEMGQAHIKKKTLELLEDKQKKAFLLNIETQEIKEMEDIIISRRHHSKNQSH